MFDGAILEKVRERCGTEPLTEVEIAEHKRLYVKYGVPLTEYANGMPTWASLVALSEVFLRRSDRLPLQPAC